MTIAEQLFISILKTKDSSSFAKIQKQWLDSSEIPLHSYIRDYYVENTELPGYKTFCKIHSLEYSDVDSKPSAYFKKLKERYVFSKVAEDTPTFLRKLKTDPMKILGDLKEFINEVSNSVEGFSSKDSLYSDNAEDRISEMQQRLLNKGITYLSMGDELLDSLFHGWHRNDLITIGGRAGVRKTWLLLYLVVLLDRVLSSMDSDYAEKYGEILFVSNEMGTEELVGRIDCINARISYSDYVSGELTRKQQSRFRKMLKGMHKSNIRIIYNCNTLMELESKIAIYNPCSVFVDGSYLMEPNEEEGHNKIIKITRGLKRISKSFAIPLANTTQLGRGKGTKKVSNFEAQDMFAFANSYSQDSDLAIVLYQNREMAFHDLVGAMIAKGRKIPPNTEVIFRCKLQSMDIGFELPDITTTSSDDTSVNY